MPVDLKNVLGDMGIEVNDKERLELLKLLPVDGRAAFGLMTSKALSFMVPIYDVYTLKCHVFRYLPAPTQQLLLSYEQCLYFCANSRTEINCQKESSSKKSMLRR